MRQFVHRGLCGTGLERLLADAVAQAWRSSAVSHDQVPGGISAALS
jgi:hypothetical protein